MRNKTLIIAEIGECWNGDIKQAEALIRCAASAGCDYVKFQTLDPLTVRPDDPEREWFLKIALDEERIAHFIACSRRDKIRPLFTPANLNKARMLKEKFNLNEIKIASSVSFNSGVLRYAAKNYKRIFLSTGMNPLERVKSMVRALERSGRELFILHSVSEYPTGELLKKRGLVPLSEEDAHLNMMVILKKLFPRHKVGYSDHTAGLLAPVCAAAAGAEVIEKHITLNRENPVKLYKSKKGYLGTDHIFSLEPQELKEMVSEIRCVEEIFGEYKWQRTKGENTLKKFLTARF